MMREQMDKYENGNFDETVTPGKLFSGSEKEKAREIFAILDGLTISQARNLLDGCKAALMFVRFDYRSVGNSF